MVTSAHTLIPTDTLPCKSDTSHAHRGESQTWQHQPSPNPPTSPSFPPASPARELTPRALILGGLFGILFGAVTVYVGLRAGLTVAASIPISVLSISILRAFGRASILENNIVQTTGNAGQSIASGVIFTLPALIFLGFDLESTRIFALALFGGWLGVLFMIPLRRQLIVEEHGTLTYPEGTACADVLDGRRARRLLRQPRLPRPRPRRPLHPLPERQSLLPLAVGSPTTSPTSAPQHLLKGSAIRADCTSEYLGVGYIIGLRVSAIMFAGGVFSWLVLMPAIYFFGSHLASPIYPGTTLIRNMTPSDLWSTYVRPMGAGAVAAAGLITLLRTAPTIFSALTEGLGSMGKNRGGKQPAAARTIRTEHDIPMPVVLGGSALLIVLMCALPRSSTPSPARRSERSPISPPLSSSSSSDFSSSPSRPASSASSAAAPLPSPA